MKTIIIPILILGIASFLTAQAKYDHTWVLGYPPNNPIKEYGGTMLKFEGDSLNLSFFNTPIVINSTAQICDEDGDLLFYSNGCKIINGSHQLMVNSTELNPGYFYDLWCKKDDVDYTAHQGTLALPWPDRAGQYVLFHMGWYQDLSYPYAYYIQDFYYTHVDMDANGGQGNVPDKNNRLVYDTSLVDNVTAVRHGNGRDWWVVLPTGNSDRIYLFLLDPEGVHGPFEQHTGLPVSRAGFTAGQIVFSPDGNHFVRANAIDGVDLLQFDRCKGVFSCPRRLPFPNNGPTNLISGAAFSPNSRYLYISATVKMFQYDLWSADMDKSKVLLGTYDGFRGPYDPSTFYQQMLAPDGKIYMSAPNGMRYLHVVHHPDSAGLASDFRQHDIKLPTTIVFCLPNFPHFRLYDAPGSPCDTLGIDAPVGYQSPWVPAASASMWLKPNPASTDFTAVFPECRGGILRVYDIAGRYLETLEVGRQVEHRFDCSNWAAGVYVLSFIPDGECEPVSVKLVVAH